MNRRAEVLLHGVPVGVLEETPDGCRFQYSQIHVATNGRPVSASLPVQSLPFFEKQLFPFFEGLLAEGELRKIQSRLAHLSENDGFGLLLATCTEDAPGAVTVRPLEDSAP